MSSQEKQKQQFERALNALIRDTEELEVVIAFDESGSIKDWKTVQICGRSLILILKGQEIDTRIALVKYDHNCSIVCDFTDSTSDLTVAVSKMNQNRGGTNLLNCLKKCSFLLQQSGRSCRKAIIILTDDDVTSARSYSQELISDEVFIICIQIGNFSADAQKEVVFLSSPDGAFFVRNLDEIRDLFTLLLQKPQSPPTLAVVDRKPFSVIFEVILEKSLRNEFQSFTIQVISDKKILKEIDTSKNTSQTRFENNVFEIQELPHDTQLSAKVKGKLKNGSETKFSETIDFRTCYSHPDQALYSNPAKLEEEVVKMKEKINKFVIPDSLSEQINIICLGAIGLGKTSFLNGAYFSLRGEFCELGVTNNQLETVTQRLLPFAINKNENLFLWDIFGEKDGSYDKIFDFLLSGKLKAGYKEGSDVDQAFQQNPTIKDIPHAVLLFISAEAANSEPSIKKVKVFYDRLIKKEFQPLIIMTKLDTMESLDLKSENTDKLYSLYDQANFDSLIQGFCATTQISRKYVFPVLNYTGPDFQLDPKDKLYLNALDAAINAGISTIKRFKVLSEKQALFKPQPSSHQEQTGSQPSTPTKIDSDIKSITPFQPPNKVESSSGISDQSTVEEVCNFIKKLGINSQPFEENEVNGFTLLSLSEEDLIQELGVPKLKAKIVMRNLTKSENPPPYNG